jgi:tRNA nucleotidyltransferase (CCA-adding enzyme)
MVQAGEVNALVAERVWKEWERSLAEKNPEIFFKVLLDCGAKNILFPSYDLAIPRLAKAAQQTKDNHVRFAVLLHDFKENEVRELCSRYRVPSDYRDFAIG